MEDPSRNRPSGELARTPGLPRPSATRQEPTAKSSPTVIDLDAVKLFLHKRMTEMEVVSHSTQTAKFLLEATLVEHHSGYPGLGVRSFGMLFPCWTGDIIRIQSRYCLGCNGAFGYLGFRGSRACVSREPTKGEASSKRLFPKCPSRYNGERNCKESQFQRQLTPEPESSVDHGSTETSLREIPSSRMEPAASTPTSVFAAPPAINRNAHRQYSPRVREPKTRNLRNPSSGEFGSVDVKGG
jgi:hypothetical protein